MCGPGHPEAASTPIVLTPNQTTSFRSVPPAPARTASSDKGAPWRLPPKAMPPVLEPKKKATPRPSAASASARPVPEFDDDDSEDEDDVRVVEQADDDGVNAEEGEEETIAEDPAIDN